MPNKASKINILEIYRRSHLNRAETDIIISLLLRKPREYILSHPETKITPAIFRKFNNLAKKRRLGWPIAYLTGHKEFYGLDFMVTPATLVPRPETELMVDEAIDMIKLINTADLEAGHKIRLIDLGTGSGAIIVALASEIRRLFPTHFPKIKFHAVDISTDALKIARQNSRKHKLGRRISFQEGDLLTPLKLTKRKLSNQRLIITANLPYLTAAQIKKSPSIRREPRLALNGGADGLKYYRKLFKQLSELGSPWQAATILCEIDPGQSRKITALAKLYWPGVSTDIKKDLAGRKRLAILSI